MDSFLGIRDQTDRHSVRYAQLILVQYTRLQPNEFNLSEYFRQSAQGITTF